MKVPTGLRAMSLANLTVWRVDPVEFINGAADAGFGAVGLLLLSPTPQPLEHEIVGRPEGTKLVVETPIREQASWSVIRRCRLAGETARVFFEKHSKITSP